VNVRYFGAGALAVAFFVAGCSGNDPGAGAPANRATTPGASTTAIVSPAGGVAGAATLGPAEHDGQRALQHIVELATIIGPRVAGTDAEGRAAGYIAGQFRADGYDVEVMDFSFEGDRFRPATVTVGGKAYQATTAAHSSGGDISRAGVFVGLADAGGIGGRDLAGKVAVADRGTLTFEEKAQNAARAGAAALIILNNQAGAVSADLHTQQDIPVVAITGEDADAVRAAARAGETIEVNSPNATSTDAKNVIARPKAGTTCKVLVGGHYDTVLSAPGANDNASGTANVIELARAFAADGLDDGLCFATFSAEESGLYGSAALAQRLKSEGALPALMVNLDVTGIGDKVDIIGDSGYVTQVLGLAKDLGIPAQRSSLPANTGSDHLSFQQVGVPVLYFESGEFATIHSPADVAKDIDIAELDRVGDLAYAAIAKLLPQSGRPRDAISTPHE
jgi:aminopeptidase YwaD